MKMYLYLWDAVQVYVFSVYDYEVLSSSDMRVAQDSCCVSSWALYLVSWQLTEILCGGPGVQAENIFR